MSLERLVERALAEQAQDMTAVPDVAALVARGTRARRRRRAILISIVAAVVIGAVAVSPMLRTTAVPAPVSQPPSPTLSAEPTAMLGPGRGTSYFAGSQPRVDLTLTMPAGWAIEYAMVRKSGRNPEIAVAFMDVANIYTDGCQWRLVDPKPGPSVDDLVSAYAKVPGSEPAEDVTLDGFTGKQIQVTVPDYIAKDCKKGGFGFLQQDNDPGAGDQPSWMATLPGGEYKVLILDVDGTRLVIFVDYPPNVSAQDRTDMDGIVSSIDIG